MVPDWETLKVILSIKSQGWIGLRLRANITIASNRLNKDEWCWSGSDGECIYAFDFLPLTGFQFGVEPNKRCVLIEPTHFQFVDVDCDDTLGIADAYNSLKDSTFCEYIKGMYSKAFLKTENA